MRGRAGDCEVDLTPTACVGEMVTDGGFAATTLAVIDRLIWEDVGGEVLGDFERFYMVCFVREV